MDVRAYLSQNKPLLFDGAMGTWFAAQSGNEGVRCEMGNLTAPDKILEIHRQYLAAGCRAIKTNTFSVSADLARGEEALAERIVEAGCRLARQAAEAYDACVFADIGPMPRDGTADAGESYIRQAALFLAQGVSFFLLETLSSMDGVEAFAKELKARCPDSFLLVSFAVQPDGVTQDGVSGNALLQSTAALAAVDAVGLNCICGPTHLLRLLQTLAPLEKPLSVMPNAGYPTVLGRRTVFQGTPAYFAEKTAEILRAGASIVGGCCGTTPTHLAQLAKELENLQKRPLIVPTSREKTAVRPVGRNELMEKMQAGKRIIAVELDPPTDDRVSVFMEGIRRFQAAGVDAVTIADCPVGRPRADSSLLSCKIKRELHIEPLPHMTCRDRNLNAAKALLLGLSMEGVHNVLLVTGDPIPTADRDEVKGVFNFNSRKLAGYVRDLNEQTLSTPFQIFGALNLNARNFQVQLELALEKEANGVQVFLTQPVLSREAFENLKLSRRTLHGKILGGIYPVVSHRNACFLNNEIAGMRVCDEIMRRYEGKNREEAEEIAVEISEKIAAEINPYTDGIYLMTPFQRVELICRILEKIKHETD